MLSSIVRLLAPALLVALLLSACGEDTLDVGFRGDDLCPDDPFKVSPGLCGCGVSDLDDDGDGTPNCNDRCPNDDQKGEPGVCGCGASDDADRDGIPDCETGCSDGQREGFRDPQLPDIAACGGGFQIPGVRTAASRGPACGRAAGDDGERPTGEGCSAADLCAEGWHVCEGVADVSASLPPGHGCVGILPVGAAPAFFATRQAGAFGGCDDIGDDDIFGCGNAGGTPINAPSCLPLDRFSDNFCNALPWPWSCGEWDESHFESQTVRKPGAAGGGVLCCRGRE